MDQQAYFEYLRKRSSLGRLYRRHYLYPRLSKWLQGKVVDVGCGIGDFLQYYDNSVGLDINPHAINYCRQLGLETYLTGNERYPFQSESFGSAMLDNVLEHLENPAHCLMEIHRLLKPQGNLVVGVPGRKGFAADADHKSFYTEERLTRTVSEFGFEKNHVIYTPFKSNWLNANITQYCLYGIFTVNPE